MLQSYGQFMTVFSKTVAERTKPGQRQDVEEKCTLLPFFPHHKKIFHEGGGLVHHIYLIPMC